MLNLKVHKKKLNNDLTILVAPKFQIPKVSTQIWYNVGSKDENEHERGIAHLIEHMVFKGTEKLSESDIGLITNNLSGSCNAFTSYDYTGYLFDLPSQNWHHSLPILADCMTGCTFKENLLSSELKAVIQELKMYKDDYLSFLLEKMIGTIFEDHPYHHPVVGYKKDLWNMNRDKLLKFYKNHYVPNNAYLVITGAIDAQTAFNKAEEAFSHIPAKENISQNRTSYHSTDIMNQNISVYRDINQPHVVLTWEIPGLKSKKDYLLNVFSWLLGSGKGSCLSKLLIDDQKLVNYVESFIYSLVEYGMFVIYFQPHKAEDIEKIKTLIFKEINSIANQNYSKTELERAYRNAKMDFISMIENQEKCAYFIGKHYAAHQDENYISDYFNLNVSCLPDEISEFTKAFLRPSIVNTGTVLPISEEEKNFWIEQQKLSDLEDLKILDKIKREDTTVELPKSANKITPNPQPEFKFPRAKSFELNNGLKVLYHHSPFIPKIDIILKFKASWHNEPENQSGALNFLMEMLQEGTHKYPGKTFIETLESYGISLNVAPGQVTMSMLSKDAQTGLALLIEMLTNAIIPADAIEKVRSRILSDLIDYWDNPIQFVDQLARETIYGNHPYHKHYLGTKKTIESTNHNILQKIYQKFITPADATLVMVGDLEPIFQEGDVKEFITNIFGSWRGDKIPPLNYPELKPEPSKSIYYPINRDQMVFAFTGLSIKRTDKDFDKLLLFDQVLTGNALGTICSRLFQIREQTGIFYTIAGSLVLGAHKQPGIILIKTIISPDQVTKAEKLISNILSEGADNLTPEKLQNSKNALASSLINNFSDNRSIASALLFVNQFDLPENFFDTRAQTLEQISLEDVKKSVERHLKVEDLSKIYIGRNLIT